MNVTIQQTCPICGAKPHHVNRYHHRAGPWTCAGNCANEYIERQAEDESLAPAYDPSVGYDATLGRGGS